MKGRVPPAAAEIRIISEGPMQTIAEALVSVQATPGMYTLEIEHDAWCGAWRTQRDADCSCKPIYRLWTLKGGAR